MTGSRRILHRLSDPVPYEYDLPPSPTTRLAEPDEFAGCTYPHTMSPAQSTHKYRAAAAWTSRMAPDDSDPSSLESSQNMEPSTEAEASGYSAASSTHRAWKTPSSPEDSKRQRQLNMTSEVHSPDKRLRYAVARQPSLSYPSYPLQDVSRQMKAVGVSGSSSLPGAFATPVRNPSLRKDSLRSVTSPNGIRMDRAALAATGFAAPRAPQLSKFDTPVCEYDGTPLEVGLGALAGLRDGLALGRKSSLNRIIMDEGLARQLEVEKVGPSQSILGRRHPSGLARGHSFHMAPDDATIHDASGPVYINSNDAFRRHLDPTVASGNFSKSLNNLDGVPRAPKMVEHSQDTDMSHGGAAEEADQWEKPDERFIQAQRAAELEASAAASVASEESRPSKLKYIVTPSNKRMGFELEPAREVVPGEASQEAVYMLGICVLAVESIWPQSRTRDDWSHRNPLNASESASNRGVLPLSHFVREVLRRSRTLPNTLQIALYYLHQSRRAIRSRVALADDAKRTYKTLLASGKAGSAGTGCSEHHTEAQDPELQNIMQAMSDPVLCGRRMFLAALMCASKYLQDRNFSNRAWAKISGLPVKEVNANERTFLFLVEYRLHVELEVFNHWIVRLQKLADDKGSSPSSKANAPVTPIKASSKSHAAEAAALSTPSKASAPTLSMTSTSNVTPPVDRLPPRNRVGVPRSFTDSMINTEKALAMSRAAVAGVTASPRSMRSTASTGGGGSGSTYDVPTSGYRSRRPAVADNTISVPTYSNLLAEREKQISMIERRREEQELQSLRTAERAATLTALRVRHERARQNSLRRSHREVEDALHYRQQQQQDHLATAAVAPSYRRGFRPSAASALATLAPAAAAIGDDDFERSDMDIDLSGLRDRPPSSCGMQETTTSMLSASDLTGRSGHGLTGLDDFGHRLNHLNHHHHHYGIPSRWGAPTHIY